MGKIIPGRVEIVFLHHFSPLVSPGSLNHFSQTCGTCSHSPALPEGSESKNNLHAQWVFKRGLFQRPHSSFLRLREQQEQLWDDQCVPGSFLRPLIKYPHSFLPDRLSCLMGVLMQSLFQLWYWGACFGTWTRTLWRRKEKGYTVHIRCRTISI